MSIYEKVRDASLLPYAEYARQFPFGERATFIAAFREAFPVGTEVWESSAKDRYGTTAQGQIYEYATIVVNIIGMNGEPGVTGQYDATKVVKK